MTIKEAIEDELKKCLAVAGPGLPKRFEINIYHNKWKMLHDEMNGPTILDVDGFKVVIGSDRSPQVLEGRL